ncbi:hypothetical protein C0995_008369 [Termitomyces sp. Mi166|nr:hypothetical protein C0995_008369 [Termitomyces sp. Mi166\
MSSRTLESPWPAKTPTTEPVSTPRKRSLRRRRIHDDGHASTSKTARRQTVVDQPEVGELEVSSSTQTAALKRNFADKALTDCQLLSDNTVISWNSRRPEITQTNLVDIFLFHGDSRQQILHFPNVANPSDQAGRINTQVNDSWWGDRATNFHGQNISYPYYWVLIPSGTTIGPNAIAQPTFTAVQTTFADFVVASISSASVASVSSASAASASSASAASALSASASSASAASASASRASESAALSTVMATSSSTSTASLQQGSSSKEFPHWAIAVIVVLGFFAIVATCVLAFLIVRRMRRRQFDSNRNSMGSASPMMANAGGPSSPLLGAGATAGSIGHGHDGATRDGASVHDGASTMSRTGSAGNNEAPFSGEDAAIMADAFRKMLRKPDFAARRAEEGESPDGPEGEGKESILGRELAEEGRDIRSVKSERGVRVETLSDGGDTVQDGH